MRGALPSLLVLVLGLAGCAGDDAGDEPEPLAETATDSTSSMAPVAPVAVQDEVVAVSWDGNTGTSAYAYEDVTGQEVGHDVVGGVNGFLVQRPGMVLVAAELTMTWTAATPATQTLTLELMVMGPHTAMVGSVSGTSGVTLSESGLALPLDNETVVHGYFYNPLAFASQPPLVVGVDVDQAAHVEGTLTFRPSAPAGG